MAKSNFVVGHSGRSVCLHIYSPPSYLDSHYQHKCMCLYYLTLLPASTAIYQAEDSCYRTTFRKTVSLIYVVLRLAILNWYLLQPVLLTRSVDHAVSFLTKEPTSA